MDRINPKRSRPLIALRARLNALPGSEDIDAFLADDAVADAAELLGFLAAPEGVDLEVQYVLGMYHWVRATRDDQEGQQDRVLALILLWPFCLEQPESLPEIVVSSFLKVRGGPLPEGQDLGYEYAEATSDLAMYLLHLQEEGDEHAGPVAIRLLRDAIVRIPAERPSRPVLLCNLGSALLAERQEESDPGVFDEPIALFRESSQLLSMGDAEYVRTMNGLAISLRTKAILSDDEAQFGESVASFRLAVNAAADHEELPNLLADLAQSLVIWSGVRPDIQRELLTEAIAAVREAIRLAPEPGPILQARLGWALLEGQSAGLPDVNLDEVVDILRQATTGFAEDSPEHAEAMALFFRATAAQTTQHSINKRGPREKALDEMLARSIPTAADGKAADPGGITAVLFDLLGMAPNNDGSRHGQLMDFAATAMRYPSEAGLLEVIAKGFQTIQQQVAHLPPDEQAEALRRLAEEVPDEPAEWPRIDTTGLAEIAALLEEELPAGTSDSDRTLVRLARMQLRLVMADHSDRDAVVDLLDQAMNTLPELMANMNLTVDMIRPMAALGGAQLSPFEGFHKAQQDIRIHRERFAALAEDDPDRPDARKALAESLFQHFQLTNDEDVFQEAVTHARALTSEPRIVGFWAAASARRAYHGSFEGGGGLAAMTANQAATSIAQSDTPGALEGIEDGRALMLSSAFNTRRELDNLRRADCALADEFVSLRERILARQQPGVLPTDQDIERFRALATEWAGLVERIEALPEFDRFLMPLPMGLADLQPAAAEGPVVTINVSARRCDAVVLRSSGGFPVPLPDLEATELTERAERFHIALTQSDVDEQELLATLGWLWDVVAGPILTALKLTDMSEQRLWWSPTGALNFLPLHAAGHHDQPGMSVLDRVVSSYTPTIRALMYSRADPVSRTRTALAVAMPQTPGHADLPSTRIEAEVIAGRIPGPPALVGPEATRPAVLYALPHSNIAHFACHAGSDPTDPSASHLLLHDGPLDVATISRLRLRNAELAYLSACATARGGVRFANEAIHIASAFQLAGFSQVVATFWEIGDDVAAAAAANFHHELAESIDLPSRIPGAVALHRVTHRMRDAWRTAPSTWAAYMHAGA